MNERTARRAYLSGCSVLVLGGIGCIVGGIVDATGFFRAWLCAYLLWIGVPLCGVTLVLVHDLSGGNWMATARPFLNAAAATMPLATLAGIPAFVGLHALYSWTHPAHDLGNAFYLNPAGFYIRYAIDVVLWNLLAAFTILGPRGLAQSIPPGLSWISGVALIALAFSAGFASIDWILSVEPTFWSSIFSYAAGAGWFNTGLALVVFSVAVGGVSIGERRRHLADLAAILLATVIFWAYAEFMQFLIIWEENLKGEIPWYLLRIDGAWQAALFVSAGFGFFLPFFTLLWAPAKRSRGIVAAVTLLILVGRVAHIWWLVLPEYPKAGPFWLDCAAVLALGAAIVLLYLFALRRLPLSVPGARFGWRPAAHG